MKSWLAGSHDLAGWVPPLLPLIASLGTHIGALHVNKVTSKSSQYYLSSLSPITAVCTCKYLFLFIYFAAEGVAGGFYRHLCVCPTSRSTSELPNEAFQKLCPRLPQLHFGFLLTFCFGSVPMYVFLFFSFSFWYGRSAHHVKQR